MFQRSPVRSIGNMAILMMVAFAVFAPVLSLSFLSDDFDMVWGTGRGAGDLHHGFFRPISFLSFRLVHIIAGDQVIIHRALNVAIHGLNAFLLFCLVSRSLADRGTTERQWAAWSAALLFIVYPYHQEAVVWIVGRYPSLTTLFILTMLWVLLRDPLPSWRWLLVGILFMLALLTYEIAVCLPLLALPLVRGGRAGFRSWAITCAVVLVLWVVSRVLITGHLTSDYIADVVHHDVWTVITGSVKVFARFVLPPCEDPGHQVIRIVVLVLGVAVLVWRVFPSAWHQQGTRRTVAAWLWMLMVSSWLAVLGGVSTRTSESDRFLYLPSAFFCGLLGLAAARIRNPVARWTLVLVLFSASMTAMNENHRHWIIASRITSSLVQDLRKEEERGPLLVTNVPDEHEGAYIFRHGTVALLLLNGIDTARVRIAPASPREELISSGARDRIDSLDMRGLSIGKLIPDPVGGRAYRRSVRWRP